MNDEGENIVAKEYLSKIGNLYDFNSNELSYVGGIENHVYSFTKDDQEYFVRIGDSKHMLFEFVEAEIDWVVYLTENDVPTVKPIQSMNGRYIEKVEKEEGYLNVVIFEKAIGKHLDHRNPQNWSDEIIINFGKITGKMHALAKNYQAKSSKRYEFQPSLDIKNMLKNEDIEIVEVITKTFHEAESLPKDKSGYGLVHGDLHSGNFFVEDNRISTILDFDRTCYKWFISELAVALFYPLYATHLSKDKEKQIEFVRRFIPLFMKGYNTENEIDSFWMEKIDLFVKVRHAILYMYLPPQFDHMREEQKKRLKEDDYLDIQEILKEL
jgi:Ser/Thr protein kinase RdoA (MazF antagonist)